MHRNTKSMNATKAVISLTVFMMGTTAWPAVVIHEMPEVGPQTNFISESNFRSSQIGGSLPVPWQSSKNAEKVSVTIETPPGRPESERWVRLVDDNDKEGANIRQSFAPVTSGRFQARLISNKSGGRLFFNLGIGGASKPEERAMQLGIESDGALLARGLRSPKTSLRIKPGEVYVIRCDFKPGEDGNSLQIRAELLEESTQQQSSVETEVRTQLAIATVRVTSTRADTGVDYYVTDLSLTGP